MQGEIWRRSVPLMAHLLAMVMDEGEASMPALVASTGGLERRPGIPWTVKTVENTIMDLTAFGVVRKVQRGRDRLVSMTVLGWAWMAHATLPGWNDRPALAEAVAVVLEDMGVKTDWVAFEGDGFEWWKNGDPALLEAEPE